MNKDDSGDSNVYWLHHIDCNNGPQQAANNSILTNEGVCIVSRYVSYLMSLKRY